MNPKQASNESDEILVATFQLGSSVFGIDARQVQEVARVGDLTPVHHAPTEVVGIRNLRGRIVTVVDLACRLRLGKVQESPENRILMIDGQGEAVGLLVDGVSEMVGVRVSDLVPPPPSLGEAQARHVQGICTSTDRLFALLNYQAMVFDGPVVEGGPSSTLAARS
jgi:purine-binding chemotaxis protein CheW